MSRFVGIATMVAIGAVFYRFVELRLLFNAFTVMVPSMAVMTAAVFVRLNRGMPSLDWKAIAPAKRPKLTSAILDITREYAGLAALNAVILLVIFGLSVTGLEALLAAFSAKHQAMISCLLGGLLAAAGYRMAYVVWRDVDIVSLQKTLIDEAAEAESAQADLKVAEEMASRMSAAGLRAVPRLVRRGLDEPETTAK